MRSALIDAISRDRDRNAGFTLLELVIVVVVVGVLLAISIPLYLNYEKGAHDRSAEADLRHTVAALQGCYSELGSFPNGTKKGATLREGPLTGCQQSVELSAGTTLTYFPVIAKKPISYVLYSTNSSGHAEHYFCYASVSGGDIRTESTLPTKAQTTCP